MYQESDIGDYIALGFLLATVIAGYLCYFGII
jgi:hypothetical protein